MAIFFVHSHFPHLHIRPFSPQSLPLPLLSPISPYPSPPPRRCTRNLAIANRMRSAWEKHERNTVNEHILYLSVRQCRLTGRIMFSTCLSVCPFVRSFVCYQLLKATLRKRMTDFNANFRKSSSGQGHERSTSRGQEVKGQGHKRPKLYLEAWRDIVLDPWVELIEAWNQRRKC